MTRRVIGAGVLTQATLFLVFNGPCTAADSAQQFADSLKGTHEHINLFQSAEPTVRIFALDRSVGDSRQRFHLELDGARTQAEDWLNDAGFSLLEERDTEGRRSYSVISEALAADWPVVRLRARVGQPQLSAGLHARREMPAIGLMVPWERYAFELEGMEDRARGYLFMGTLRWSDPQQRLQYGIAFPIALTGAHSIGALLQIRMRFGK